MILGIPRGAIYYDYISFLRQLFIGTGIVLREGPENDETILANGSMRTVDEACLPIKLMAGQCKYLEETCDKVLLLRIMKDINGKWLCPKILGQSQLMTVGVNPDKYLLSEAIFLNEEKSTYKALLKLSKVLKIEKEKFKKNFIKAYGEMKNYNTGKNNIYVETAWEFTPATPKHGEIILPNTRKILLTGHFYNVYDKFINMDIMHRLDDLAIGTLTEKDVSVEDQYEAIKKLELMKEPYWESAVRTLGTAICLKEKVDGIIYLSSFSCGIDSVIIELMKMHIPELPIMILKLDGHSGTAGYLTRIEAFSDLLEKRNVS